MNLLAGSVPFQQDFDFLQPLVDTILLPHAIRNRSEHVPRFATKSFALKLDVMLPLQIFDELLRSERQEHAKNDNPHFTGKRAPAV
jgi:hypothetical protein